MYDIVALGEILIDFTPDLRPQAGSVPAYLQNPGGAPANVLVMAAKLGKKTAFIGKAGQDFLGDFLEETLRKEGVDPAGLCRDPQHPTTLALVQLDARGDRSFSFYRDHCADVQLSPEDIPQQLLTNCRVFHFGSVSLTGQPCRSATLLSAKKARESGALVSFDPNLRPLLWKGPLQAKNEILRAIPMCDLLKVSGEEMEFLTGCSQVEEGAAQLLDMGPAAVVVTLGEHGAYVRTGSAQGHLPAYPLEAVDTTGAGDAFWGAVLSFLTGLDREAVQRLDQSRWEQIIRFANAAGGLTTCRKGAIPAMPQPEDIQRLLDGEHPLPQA